MLVTGAEETQLQRAVLVRIDEPVAVAHGPPGNRLFAKYTILFIGLVGAALLINSGFDFWFSYQENKAALDEVGGDLSV